MIPQGVSGATTAYRRWLPSPLLGEPEYVIEQYVFEKMVQSGDYSWVATQWAISATDRPDIVARSDGEHPIWTIVEVKAEPLRDRHFKQLERYVDRLGQMIGWRRVMGILVSPDIPLHQAAFGKGRVFYAPPEFIALHRTMDAIAAKEAEL